MAQNSPRKTATRATKPSPSRVPLPRLSKERNRSGSRTGSEDRYLLTARDLLILLITSVVGLLAAVVSGLTVAMQTNEALGFSPSVALGIAAGVVALVTTALVVANKLHKLVQ
ncbi:hypothetical protein [Micromonospora sp. NBC_00421]|uniref:hypothetical protein n=1 Tax=Micromonospora sp. NBC_00421 TaxID=2975976 RepID=UPI002E1CA9F5